MASRQGSLLEENVESIFSSAGFDTETNTFISDYEIDVCSKLGDIEVIAECKQYEKSNLQIKNLIHEWKGKNKSIGADIVIIVIYGQEISKKEKELAEDNNILIWDEGEIKKLLAKDDEATREYIFDNLPLKEESIGKSYEKRIHKLVWKPYLEGSNVDTNLSYQEMLLMVKERIRRELFQRGTTEIERRKHIEVFEEVKKDGIIRSNINVKKSKKKFERIVEDLNNNITDIKENREDKYVSYLHSVKDMYDEAKTYYLESSGQKQVKRLVEARLQYLMRHGADVEFSPRKSDKPINASRQNAKFSLDFEINKAGDLETIRWILMKEGTHRQVESDNKIKDMVSFTYDDVEEATQAVIRIMTEYYEFDLEKIRLVDKKKDEMVKGESFISKLLR